MATKEEYSVMAAAVYNDARGDANKVDISTIGWELISQQSDTTGGVFSSGLSINAYKKGTEVVISCKGTDFLIGTNNSQTASDLIADIALGGSLGFSSSQLFSAALFYQRVKEQNPGANITFTGHSLGAGLASILAVWFNRPATVFADAPFEATALNPIVMGFVAGHLALNGYSDPEFVNFIGTYPIVYGGRESQVTNYFVKDELLNNWLGFLPFVAGTNTKIDVGGSDQLSPITLHSVVLHSSLLISDRLRQNTFALPNLLAEIFSPTAYAFAPEGGAKDFLTGLLNDQIRVGYTNPDGLLARFATDIQKLTQYGARLKEGALGKALIDVTIADYYFMQSGFTKDFFTGITGGISFDLKDIGANWASNKTVINLDNAAAAQLGLGILDRSVLTRSNYWSIQSGTEAMNAVGVGTNNDAMLGGTTDDSMDGGAGNDFLFGGDGTDTIVAGSGDDRLIGGAGNDTLNGGAGFDTYLIQDQDTILDSDGKGVVKNRDGTAISGLIQQAQDGSYFLIGDSSVSVTLNTNLSLGLADGSTVTIENFQNGDLGFQVVDVATTTTTITITGDLRLWDSDPATDGDQLQYDALGNPIQLSGQNAPGLEDHLFDSAGNDHITSLGGNDDVSADAGGDDWIQLGNGNDFGAGRNGNDLVEGEAGADFVAGDADEDRVYADSEIEVDDAIANGETDTANNASSAAQWADGGAGADLVIASATADVVMGGGGADVLVGGAGNDILHGDAGRTFVNAGWTVTRETVTTGNATTYTERFTNASYEVAAGGAADALYGGAGSDWVYGETGDDLLDAGSGDDVAFGGDDNDTILGRSGADTLNGDAGDDFVDGGDDDDGVSGGAGADALYGGAGNDTITGDALGLSVAEQGADYLDGEEGDDVLIGGGGADELFGGAGNDQLFGESVDTPLAAQGDDYLDGEEGDDVLVGGGGADVLFGGAGNDELFGEASDTPMAANGDDYLDGEAGNDTLVGAGGSDTLIGGAGADVLHGDGTGLAAQYHGADVIEGGDDNDQIFAGGGADRISGDAGSDTISAQAGDDIASGGDGADVIDGGDGNDVLAGDAGSDQLQGGIGNDLLDGGADNDTLIGQEGNDTLLGQGGADLIDGGDGADLLDGGAGNDQLQAGAGNDTLIGGDGDDVMVGQGGDDYLEGGVGNDTMQGDDGGAPLVGGNDTLLGGAGDDYLDAGAGSDVVDGGDGNDTLFSGTGADTLTGGAGDDVIVLNGAGVKRISDEGGTDAVRIVGVDFQDVVLRLGSLVIDTGVAGNEIHIDDFNPDDPLGSGSIESFEFDDGIYSYAQLLAKGIVIDGTAAADELHGTGVDDRMTGGTGDDTVLGGAGDDRYYYALGDGNDAIIDASGSNTLVFGSGISAANLGVGMDAASGHLYLTAGSGRIDIGAAAAASVQRIEYADGTSTTLNQFLLTKSIDIVGTPGVDSLVGTVGSDRIRGLAGNDTLQGGGNVDTYLFERGDGADVIVDGGINVLALGAGITADSIAVTYVAGNLVLDLGNGDKIDIGSLGNPMPDLFNTSPFIWPAVSTLQFADGTTTSVQDFVMSRGLTQTGATSSDTLIGIDFYEGLLPDRLDGKAGADTLKGGAGNDIYVFNRGDGADKIIDTDGTNVLQFGSGIAVGDITVTWRHDLGFVGQRPTLGINLINGDSINIGETPNVQNLRFADGTSVGVSELIAQRGIVNTSTSVHFGEEWFAYPGVDNTMAGQAGDDRIFGDSGSDTITGGTGLDRLTGGGGSDVYIYNRGDGADVIYDVYADNNTLRLGVGLGLVDIVPTWRRHGFASYPLTLGIGTGSVYLGSPNDPAITTIALNDGSTVSLANLLVQKGLFSATGTAGSDRLANFATGAPLLGLGGDDTLWGYITDDVLNGGTGNDLLVGGRGSDTYVFNLGDGSDQIEDFAKFDGFAVDANVLVFGSGITPESLRPVYDQVTQVMGFDLGGGDMVTVGDAQLSSIQQLSFADGTSFNLDEVINRVGGFQLLGSVGDDTISGTPFTDNLIGGSGNDNLSAALGNDFLTGGTGDDSVGGDLGNDTYYFGRGDGNDVISDGIRGPFGEAIGPDETNTLVFLGDITPSSVTYDASDRFNVLLRVDTGETVNIGPVSYPAIQKIVYGNGLTFTLAQLIAGAPVQIPLADQVTQQGASFSYTLPLQALADPNGDALTYGVSASYSTSTGFGLSPLTWLTFNPATRTFSGTPTNSHVATSTIGISATDPAGNFVGSTFKLQVLNVNDAPTVQIPLAGQIGNWLANVPLNFTFNQNTFADIDAARYGDRLTYTATQSNGAALPAWLTFDSVARRFGGTPTNLDAGSYALMVTATDTGGLFATNNFSLNVLFNNRKPVVNVPVADQLSYEDSTYTFAVPVATFLDADGDALTYTATQADGTALPTWLEFDPTTRVFSGTPSNGDVGVVRLHLEARDTGGLASATDFNMQVFNVNDAPVAIGDAVIADEDLSLLLPAALLLENDSDIDPTADVLRVATVDAPTHGTVTLDEGGNVTFIPDANFNGTAGFDYTVSDGNGGVATTHVDIDVRPVNDIPFLVAPLLDQSVVGGNVYTWTVPVAAFGDIDVGDTLSYSASLSNGAALPSWLVFNATTRTFSGTAPTTAATVDVKVAASDGQGVTSVATDTFRITVSGVTTGGGCGHGNEGVGNGEDSPPPGHDYNHNDGPGTGPGKPGNQHGHGKGDDDEDRDRKNHKSKPCLDPRSVANQCTDFGDDHSGNTGRSTAGKSNFAQWLAVDQAIALQASSANRGLPSLSKDKGADMIGLTGIGKDSSVGKRTGADPISLLSGNQNQQMFVGLNNGMRRFGG